MYLETAIGEQDERLEIHTGIIRRGISFRIHGGVQRTYSHIYSAS
jgi:hypothetical protein